ncbi:MAG: MFS transporter, partial [Chlamydiae bacterium]|nr:MFS transporter [Chlamydiota bacterium]
MSGVIVKERRMGWALFLSSALSEPLFTLYGLIAIILYKDLGASAWQIALMTMLKPVISLLSVYWSAGLHRSGKVKSNVLWGGFLMRAPFLLCPWIDSVWFVIGASVNYMLFHRAVIPGWMEILRRNMGEGKRGRAFSLSSAFGYVEGVALSIGAAALLDHQPGMWKILFCVAALIGMGVLLIQARLSVDEERKEELRPSISFKEFLLRPWKDTWQLMRERPDFSKYQFGFMICGFGIMLIQPALPIFAVDDLGVSYTMAALGISLAKGLG